MTEKEATALWKAVNDGHMPTIKKLIAIADPKQDQEALNRALSTAARCRRADLMELCFSAGAKPNQQRLDSLLPGAAMNGDLPIVKRLIEAGANFNLEVKRETPLSAALSYNEVAVIEYLEKLGAKSPPTTTLLYASMHGDVERAKLALSEGAGIEKTGGIFRETPLMAAARKGQVETVKLLLQHGAKPNTRIDNKTALFEAVQHGKNLEVLEALVSAGADIHVKDYEETVLMAAAQGGSLPIVKRLVELGADVNHRDKHHGKTALDHAKASKNKELIAYLSGLGAVAERDGGRSLMGALKKEFGGKLYEHVHGFSLNSKLAGNKCQIHSLPDSCRVNVFKLNYSSRDFSGMPFPEISMSTGAREESRRKLHRSESASAKLGLEVYSTIPADDKNAQKALASFCNSLQKHLDSLKLVPKECIYFTGNTLSFAWIGTDAKAVLPRLHLIASLIQDITRTPQETRLLFATEWLLKPAPKSATSPHSFGGSLAEPVECPECGSATNLMAQLDLSDPALPKSALGPAKLPVFWCLDCLEWDPAFFDISGPLPKAFAKAGEKKASSKIPEGEEDLPARQMTLVQVAAGKKAGKKNKLGEAPNWIQQEEIPDCPKCRKPMAFALQLASDSRISYCDMGMLYAFACPECKVTASLIQSH